MGGSTRFVNVQSPQLQVSLQVKVADHFREWTNQSAKISRLRFAWRQRLRDRNLNWTVSLRVRNLLDDDATTPASAVDNGRGQAHILQRIYQTPRTGELSAGVRF